MILFQGVTMWFVKSKRAQTNEDYESWIEGVVTPTLNAMDNNGEAYATVLILDGTRVDDVRIYGDEIMQTVIQRWGTGGGNVPAIQKSNDEIVRRLTPVECERLQGFPDNWTDGQADSNRYKQMGNAVAVPVVEWIISRMVAND
jgi:site-specific DNA-cytosine methylase